MNTNSGTVYSFPQDSQDEQEAGMSALSPKNTDQSTGGITGQRLISFIERIERLEEEKAGLASDIKDIYAEAKGTGFDVKTMRKIIRLRKMDTDKRHEEEALLDLYKTAIGIV